MTVFVSEIISHFLTLRTRRVLEQHSHEKGMGKFTNLLLKECKKLMKRIGWYGAFSSRSLKLITEKLLPLLF